MKYGWICFALCCTVVLFSLYDKRLYTLNRRQFDRKYSPNNPLVSTVTPSYSLSTSKTASSEEVRPIKSSDRLENKVFKASSMYSRSFDIDDTETIRRAHPEVVCMPEVFGYSVAQGQQVFPPYEYPDCAESKYQAEIRLDFKTNSVEIECPNSRKPEYVTTDPKFDPKKQYLQFEMQDFWTPKKTSKDQISPTTDFIYASCSDPPSYKSAVYKPRFNQTANDRAAAVMKAKGATRPVTVLMLTLDSFSRRHFFRKLPKTVAFLNSLNQDSPYAVFDFKISNIEDSTTADNIIPFLGSKAYADQTKVEYKDPPDRDILGDSALWNKFRAQVAFTQGFVTYAGFEDCDYLVPRSTGRAINTDHLTRAFYCAANDLLNLKMDKEALGQRCIGPHMSHYYILNYTSSFAELYAEVNQWIYLHLNAAHEITGQHAATLDNDLVGFLKPYLANTDRDIVVILQGDHGMRYGNWFKDIEAYQENKLPALFFIAPKSVLDKVPYSYDTLWYNTHHLVAKRDLRALTLAFLEWPYGALHDVHSEAYLDAYYNLLTERIPDTRTCESIQVLPWQCSCLVMQTVDPELYGQGGALHDIVSTIVREAVENINQRVYGSPLVPKGLVCMKLSANAVLKVYGLKINNVMEQFQVQFSVNESPTAIFEVYSVFGTQERGHIMRPDNERGSIGMTAYRGFKTRLKVGLT
jgi:hypothetical protein